METSDTTFYDNIKKERLAKVVEAISNYRNELIQVHKKHTDIIKLLDDVDGKWNSYDGDGDVKNRFTGDANDFESLYDAFMDTDDTEFTIQALFHLLESLK